MVLAWHSASADGLCTFSPINIVLPSVSAVSGGAITVTATTNISCSGLPVGNVRVCLQLGAGSTYDAAPATRYMANGNVGQMQYNVYTDASYSTVWGTYANPPVGYTDVALSNLLTGSGSMQLYFKIPGGQTGLTQGTYTASLTANSVATYVQWLLGYSHACNTTIENNLGTVPITISATVIADCSITTSNIAFGNQGLLNTALTANGAISVQCTNGSPYTIALDKGTTSGATLLDRQLKSGSNVVHYQLYSDSARTTVWGDGTSGAPTLGKTGTGGIQSWPVYARIPVQTTPATGTYTDTITATVSF
ncbi:spore coat U domain-containing protein [Silvimonas sp. JCM 19000]